MGTLKLKDWLFPIEFEGEDFFSLYAPLHGVALYLKKEALNQVTLLVSGKAEEIADSIESLFYHYGLFELPEFWKLLEEKGDKIVGHSLTLSITNKCNLRCIYCYAKTGEVFSTMDWEVAKTAIDREIEKALSLGRNKIRIVFHGGGEAFVEYELLRKCVSYATTLTQKLNLDLDLSVVTNATLIDSEKAMWMKNSGFKHVTVSLDGLEKTQNYQRPQIDGCGSFDRVVKAVGLLKLYGVPFDFRATVTKFGVNEMDDFVVEVARIVDPIKCGIHFEPVDLCGRAVDENLSITPHDFFLNYKKAKKIGEKVGVKVVCSSDKFKRDKLRYCGASNAGMFCVTPEGFVSACSRIIKQSDYGSELYFYGQYNASNKTFDLDEHKRLQIFKHGRLPSKCEDCFARWNCQGGCPISRYSNTEDFDSYCKLTRRTLKDSILEEYLSQEIR